MACEYSTSSPTSPIIVIIINFIDDRMRITYHEYQWLILGWFDWEREREGGRERKREQTTTVIEWLSDWWRWVVIRRPIQPIGISMETAVGMVAVLTKAWGMQRSRTRARLAALILAAHVPMIEWLWWSWQPAWSTWAPMNVGKVSKRILACVKKCKPDHRVPNRAACLPASSSRAIPIDRSSGPNKRPKPSRLERLPSSSFVTAPPFVLHRVFGDPGLDPSF